MSLFQDTVDTSNRFLTCNCLPADGGQFRTVLRFSVSVDNVGSEPAVYPALPEGLASPVTTDPFWTFNECREEWTLAEWALYEILGPDGTLLLSGVKYGYCTYDYTCSGGVSPRFTCDPAGRQGISVGCRDTYDYNQPCNMIDITTLNQTLGYDPEAEYSLRVTFNPAGKVDEADLTNNAATATFIPAAVPVRS